MAGLNIFDGMITYKAVAESLGHKFFDPQEIL
jgi:alanine dehydrogenase